MKCLLGALGGAVVLNQKSPCAGLSRAHGRSSFSPTDFNLARFLAIESFLICVNVRSCLRSASRISLKRLHEADIFNRARNQTFILFCSRTLKQTRLTKDINLSL